jgi:hypothetical protein
MSDLDKLLKDSARPVPVSDQLMARILADAAREQPIPKSFGSATVVKRPSFWSVVSDLFGGNGVLAGLATVACAGVYLGAAQPSAVTDVTAFMTGDLAVETLDFMPSIDALLAEE